LPFHVTPRNYCPGFESIKAVHLVVSLPMTYIHNSRQFYLYPSTSGTRSSPEHPTPPNQPHITMDSTLSTLQSSKAQGSREFTKFGALPPELRIRIWQDAMPEARTVVVQSPLSPRTSALKSLEDAVAQPTTKDVGTWSSNTQIPALLHVNAEARHEALKHYQLSLGANEQQPRIYVDFTRDTLFFSHTELKPECSSLWSSTKDLDRVERLAVVPEGAWRVLRWMKSLQKLIFVHDTEKIQLGPSPQLVEDEAPQEETEEELVELVEEAQMAEDTTAAVTAAAVEAHPDAETKQRMQAAREELDNVMMVLTTQWETQPMLATAVFNKSPGDTWVA
jgi:hypothetical protein